MTDQELKDWFAVHQFEAPGVSVEARIDDIMRRFAQKDGMMLACDAQELRGFFLRAMKAIERDLQPNTQVTLTFGDDVPEGKREQFLAEVDKAAKELGAKYQVDYTPHPYSDRKDGLGVQ
jgi:hypothetical protein